MRLIVFAVAFFLNLSCYSAAEYDATWVDITEDRDKELGKYHNSFISRAMFYTRVSKDSPDFNTSKRIVLFAIHGTFETGDPLLSEDNNPTFEALKEYAESLGDNVELVSIGWSGDAEHTARANTFEYMKYIFEKEYNKSNIFTQINMLGYSHGGNIIAMMTQDKFFNKKINNVITIYTPVRDDYPINLKAIKGKLYHFYSTGDVIQYPGSFSISDFSYKSLWPWLTKSTLSSKLFPIPIPFLLSNEIARARNALVRSVLTGTSPFYFTGGRKMATFGNTVAPAKAYNYRVQVDGVSPSHWNIYWIIKYLAKIIKETNRRYKYNFDLEVNIDTKENTIQLAIGTEYPAIVVHNTAEEMKNSGKAWAFNRVMDKEKAFSEKEKAKFQEKYKKPMGEISYIREAYRSRFAPGPKTKLDWPVLLFGQPIKRC